jgi:hypothetical protein
MTTTCTCLPEDEWESKWNDFGTLPLQIIPEFNVALAKFIFKFTGTKTSFPEMLLQGGGGSYGLKVFTGF